MTHLPFATSVGRRAVPLFVLALGAALMGCDSRDPRAVSSVSAGLAPVVDGNNDFAWKLYSRVSHGEGNLFFSPFSVSAAFGMTWAGAAGDTATQMHDVLSVRTSDDAAFHQNFGALLRDLGGEHAGRGYELYVADRLFGQKGATFDPGFLAIAKNDYAAPLEQVDYNAPDAAVKQINTWVDGVTSGKIPQLVDTDLVGPDTRIVLANAIYFKATWATQFDPSLTKPTPFQKLDGTSIDVPMMSTSGEVKLRAAGDAHALVLDLPYQDDELSMVIVMPTEGGSFSDLEPTLTREYVDGLIASETPFEAYVTMPRWELGETLDLEKVLVDMGMTNAFDPQQADFSKLTGSPDSGFHLDFAVHKAYVKVDEEGTEAAAATATGGALSLPPTELVDRPFVYLIRDRLTGSILFMGRMLDPTDSGTL